MSKFTKDAPFVFGGVRVWREDDGHLKCFGGRFNEDQARAYHAFIEAERNEWAWTNDEHTEARKGRWVAESGVRFEWSMRHQDLPNIVCVHPSPGDESYHRYVREALNDFLAWRAAQNRPAEPTGLGAVVEDVAGDTWTRADRGVLPWFKTARDGNAGATVWGRWADIIGPVTILSPGVDA